MEIQAGRTHYMRIRYPVTGLPLSQWTIDLAKDGEARPDIPVYVSEAPDGYYTFYFTNDGADKAQWSLMVTPKDLTSMHYVETWLVRKPVIEQAVLQMQAAAVTGDSGFTAGQ